MKKTLYTNQTIDYTTGEVKNSSWLKREDASTEQFAKLYFQYLNVLIECRGAEVSTFLYCVSYAIYNTNEVILSPARKLEICKATKLKVSTVNAAIATLIQKNILVKMDRRLYIHPLIFFSGTDAERFNLLKFTSNFHLTSEE
jgi:hypothetical protein